MEVTNRLQVGKCIAIWMAFISLVSILGLIERMHVTQFPNLHRDWRGRFRAPAFLTWRNKWGSRSRIFKHSSSWEHFHFPWEMSLVSLFQKSVSKRGYRPHFRIEVYFQRVWPLTAPTCQPSCFGSAHSSPSSTPPCPSQTPSTSCASSQYSWSYSWAWWIQVKGVCQSFTYHKHI